jgi:hypothetical protein
VLSLYLLQFLADLDVAIRGLPSVCGTPWPDREKEVLEFHVLCPQGGVTFTVSRVPCRIEPKSFSLGHPLISNLAQATSFQIFPCSLPVFPRNTFQ